MNKLLPELAKIETEYFDLCNHLPPIPLDIEVMRASSKGNVPFDSMSPNTFTLSVVRIARRITTQFTKDIDDWLDERSQELRKPLVKQLGEISVLLDDVHERLAKARFYSIEPIFRSTDSFLRVLSRGLRVFFWPSLRRERARIEAHELEIEFDRLLQKRLSWSPFWPLNQKA